MHSSIRIAVEFLELAKKQTHYKEITTMVTKIGLYCSRLDVRFV